jgi:hypothetical protein
MPLEKKALKIFNSVVKFILQTVMRRLDANDRKQFHKQPRYGTMVGHDFEVLRHRQRCGLVVRTLNMGMCCLQTVFAKRRALQPHAALHHTETLTTLVLGQFAAHSALAGS